MEIGERIRRIRMKRGMTQKELGLALGFPENSADVRIAQYESGKRKPKEDVILQLAAVLRVDPRAISSTDYSSYIGLMYTLFDLEDTYGIHIDQIDDELCLRLDKRSESYLQLFDLFQEWYKAWKVDHDADDIDSFEAYTDWKLNYPHPMKKR